MDVGAEWVKAVSGLGGDTEVARASGHDLSVRYAEPHRRYHRTSHVEAVLVDAARLATAERLSELERAVLTLAVCAHDVIYNAKPGDDETASAQWARVGLVEAGLDDIVVSQVESLVLTTLTHSFEPDDVLASVLSDADLAILGADLATYDGYSAAVRDEFSAIPDDLWAIGRRHVLEALLAKPRLYVTDEGFAQWETQARDNIRREFLALPPAD